MYLALTLPLERTGRHRPRLPRKQPDAQDQHGDEDENREDTSVWHLDTGEFCRQAQEPRKSADGTQPAQPAGYGPAPEK